MVKAAASYTDSALADKTYGGLEIDKVHQKKIKRLSHLGETAST
jgi:hypothetical protein